MQLIPSAPTVKAPEDRFTGDVYLDILHNGLTEAELKETIIHLAFYAGWPKAMSAITVAKEIFRS